MRKPIIALGTFGGGITYAAVWTKILDIAFNYREINAGDGVFLFSLMFICFYYFGLYISAAIFGFFSKRQRDIAPSALPKLVYGFLGSFTLSFLITLILFLFVIKPPTIFFSDVTFYFIILSIIFILHVLVVRTAYEFETNKSSKYFIVKIATVLLVNLTLLLVVCINDFPGVNAPVEIRQKWAYEKFRYYPSIVCTIKQANQITDKVGQIKFAAPTRGRNLPVIIGGSSGPSSELTLEVVGEKGTGIAYITTWAGGVHGIYFEYQGKKTKITAWSTIGCEN
ncbi:hypothetical protein [Allocoleopsis sp.]|uniref:hypothetical protein n=1 Tax=Allocoleopsis sp. TaxID=3088169 RepID=UPI002FD202E9